MNKVYLGDEEVLGCFFSDDKIDMAFFGDVVVCEMIPPVLRFIMQITAPNKPIYAVEGGSLTTVDNNDGTWTLSSFDAITRIQSSGKNETEVVMELALDLINVDDSWESCTSLTSFDTSSLTNVTEARNTWNGCTGLTSFDTSPLTLVTVIEGTWDGCTRLTSFDASGLVSATDARDAWQYCTSLTSFDASSLTSATDVHSAWYGCTGLTSFDASGLTSVTNAQSAWSGCTNLVCLNELDSTGFTTVYGRTEMFLNCTSLVAPNAAEQTDLQDTDGAVYVNASACPPPRFLMKVTAPTQPTYTATGGTLTTVDNNDGTWTLSSFDAITGLKSVSFNETEVVVEFALDLVEIDGAWSHCLKLTSFDASGLTSVTNAANAWNYCQSLTSFDTSGLTSVIIASQAWNMCKGLTTFDASGLTSVTNVSQAWNHCDGLTSFDASALTNLDTYNGLFANISALKCISKIDTTTWTGNKSMLLLDRLSLTSPTRAEQNLLMSTAGYNYVNPNPCP